MKLRQKLAMVLATAMIVTSVPVVTMAKSTNNVTKVLTVQKDANIGWEKNTDGTITTSGVVELKITPDDGINVGDEFYLQLENGEWAEEDLFTQVFSTEGWTAANGDEFAVTRVNDTEVKVEVRALNHTTTSTFKIPVLAVATGGNVKLKVIPETSTLTPSEFIIATTPEEDVKGTVSVGEVPSFYTSGELAPITVEEVAPGTFNGLDDEGFVKVTLNHSDFEFVSGTTVAAITVDGNSIKGYETTVTQTGSRGLADIATTITAYVDLKDAQVMYIKLPENTAQKSRGVVEFSGIQVKSTTRTPETGNLTADITGVSVTDKTDAVVAKVAEYGVSLTMKNDKVVDINEGRAGKVTFTLAENVEDSISTGAARTVLFTLGEGAHFNFTASNAEKGVTEADVKAALTVKDKDNSAVSFDVVDVVTTEDEATGEEFVTGFEVKFATTNEDELDSFKFVDVPVHAELGQAGEVVLKAEGRAIGEAVEATAINIVDVVDWETEAMTVKVGLKEQEGGKIVISEKDKEVFKKGGVLTFTIEDEEGLTFTGKPEITVTKGDIQLGEAKLTTGGQLSIEIKRASKEASSIQIEGFGVKVDRTVPQGTYDLTIGGSALTDCNTVEVEDFFVVGTPNTEDITNQVKKVVSVFSIGSTEYTVNETKLTMDAVPYISAENRTMVPVRYVADAFGIDAKDILFSNSTVTILAGSRTIQLTAGSDVATLNGAPIKMSSKVVISKENRTYVPIAEIARLLGVSYTWDNETKTVTFENK